MTITYTNYAQAKERIDEIVAAVGSNELPMDDALSLYEEAVDIGLQVSALIEKDLERKAKEAPRQGEGGENDG